MGSKTSIIAMSLVVLAWGVAVSAGAEAQGKTESPSVLLEKGIFAEETRGDLDAAMKSYKQIIDNAKANRRYVAEAQYRLGNCYLKQNKPQDALRAFNRVISKFPKQKKLVASATKRRAETFKKLGHADVAEIVNKVVVTISTCAEGDPRITKALASLEGLDEQAVVSMVASHLDSEEATVRRSAIYVLWKGPFEGISSADDELLKLCSHSEYFTRGMAALALGERKVEAAFETIAKMTLEDSSGYARRCAAYALGTMGKPEGIPILEKAIKDKDELVRNNAEHALKLLKPAATKDRLPFEVMAYIVDTHMIAHGEAAEKGLHVNSHIYGTDDKGNFGSGGLLMYKNTTGEPINEPIPLGNFSYSNLELIDEQGAIQQVRMIERPTRRRGKYRMLWTPDKPIPAGANRVLGWRRADRKLLKVADGYRLKMNNHFGSPVLENFFLVLPPNVEIVKPSRSFKSRTRIANMDVYLWQREVPANTTNQVTMILKTTDTRLTEISYDDGKSAGKHSIAGSGHGVKFDAPGTGYELTSVSIYGSRYGYSKPPAENFTVWICDGNFKVLVKHEFPYSTFKRGEAKWVRLPISPILVPREFAVVVGFNPGRTKGVYVHYDADRSGRSYTGLPDRGLNGSGWGDWMIRATLKATAPSVASRKVLLPDVDESKVMLDLASGRLVPVPDVDKSKIIAAIEELGRGDLVYEKLREKHRLTFVRSAKSDKKLPLLPQFAIPYDIISPPWPYKFQVTTKEGNKYDVSILKADEKGCEIEYSPVAEQKPTAHVKVSYRRAALADWVADRRTAENASSTARRFFMHLAAGEVDDAYKMTTEQYRQHHKGLAKLPERIDLSNVKLDQVLFAIEAACVVTSEMPAKAGDKKVAIGLGLIRHGRTWLIRDIDALPHEKAKTKFVEGFKQAFPKHKDAKAGLKKARRADKEMVASVAVAESWLKTVDEGKYEASWNDAAVYFKAAVTAEQWDSSLSAVRTPLGAVKSRKRISATYTTSIPGAPDGEYVVIQYKTQFENKKDAVETVTPMKDKDGVWRVSGYYVK